MLKLGMINKKTQKEISHQLHFCKLMNF